MRSFYFIFFLLKFQCICEYVKMTESHLKAVKTADRKCIKN